MSERLEITDRQFLSVNGLSANRRIKVSSYDDPAGSEAMGLLLDCHRAAGDQLSEHSLENLRLKLRTFRSSLKSLIAADPRAIWKELKEGLLIGATEQKEFLTPQFLESIHRVLEHFTLDELAKIADLRAERILSNVGQEKTLLVAETPRLSRLLSDWVDHQRFDIHPDTQVHLDAANFSKLKNLGFEHLSFVGLPSMYLSRQNYQSQFRALVLSGIAPKVTFTGPSWLRRPADARFTEHLLWNLPGLDSPVPMLTGPEAVKPWISDLDQADLIDESSRQAVEDDEIQPLETTGTLIPARIIQLANGLGYPVEDEAQNVSKLDLARHETAKIKMVHPFEELAIGDVLVANVAGSEQDVLRYKVREKIGHEEYQSFLEAASWWKETARTELSRNAEPFLRNLVSNGCERVHRLEYWISDECVMPKYESDFVALLKSLGTEGVSIVEILKRSRRFLSLLRAAGLEARKSLEESISIEQIEKLMSGETVSVEVDGYFGAEYLLSPVVMVEDEIRNVSARQIRRIVRLKEVKE